MRIGLASSALPLAALAALTGCGDEVHRSSGPSEHVAAWHRLPDPPIDARSGPVVSWTGSEVLVVGGDTSAPCPPTADCAGPEHYARDGARYVVSEGRWRRISDAPEEVPAFAPSALVQGRLFVLAHEVLLQYDVAADAWATVPTPSDLSGRQLVADGERLLVASGSDEHGVVPDRVFDTATERWSTLPDDPIGAAFDRVFTAVPGGLVLTAHERVPNPGADGPSLVLAARFDHATGAWTRLPDSDQLGGWAWSWTGRRLVDPTPGGSDGGKVGNYGRTVPYGGVLDPATGTWSRLRHAPKGIGDGWQVEARGGRFAAVGGWIYDDETETWAAVPRPDDAPGDPGAAVWADDRLVVIGGTDYDRGFTTDALSTHAWISASGAALGKAVQ